jgi:hypothetical protein
MIDFLFGVGFLCSAKTRRPKGREREDFLFHFFLNHSLGLISEKGKKSRRKRSVALFFAFALKPL